MEALLRRIDEIEARLTNLELGYVKDLLRRVAALEGGVPAAEPAPPRAPAPRPPPAPAPEAQDVEVVEPPPPPPVRPVAAPPRPARSLEVDFGRWILSRLGGLALVLAAGFLFHYAARRGWLGEGMRIALGFLSGGALLALGEWQARKFRSFAAALTGAGIAILHVSVFAGHALYGFYGSPAALALAVGVTAGGVAQALRHRVEAVAGLAAVGGFLAPLLVLNLHAQPHTALAYVLVLNLGLCVLRARTGWRSPEAIAWLGTPVVAAQPMTGVGLVEGLAFLLGYVVLFGVRPRSTPSRWAASYVLVLSAATALASYALFRIHATPHWYVFAGGCAAVLFPTSWLGKDGDVAWADFTAAVGFAVLAVADGLDGWHVTLGWAVLAAALLLLPLARFGRRARLAGTVVAFLCVLHVAAVDALRPDDRLAAFLLAAAALTAIRATWALWSGVVVASLGVAVEIATRMGRNPWLTLLLLERAAARPSARLVAGSALAVLPGIFAAYRRNARGIRICVVAVAMLVAAEALFAIDGSGVMPLGLVAAALMLATAPWSRSVWAVVAGLALAVAGDLIPPSGYLPFLNRRAFALGAVLGSGWFLLRRSPEGRAAALLAALLAAAEVAAVPDRAGGRVPWLHLLLELETTAGATAFWNARFLFLLGAAATAWLAARRWTWCIVIAHLYLVTALGAEAAGLVRADVRSDPWRIFDDAAANMAPNLALTGVILTYGAALVVAGLKRGAVLSRRTGLGLLVAGGLKVSIFDLTALGDLYRVGSFLVLGLTFLLGSYAYNRWFQERPKP